MVHIHYIAPVIIFALITGACGPPMEMEEDGSFDVAQTVEPLNSGWHPALLTHRITGNDQRYADKVYCRDSSKNMDHVNNTCMLPLPTASTMAGINRATAAATLGIPQGPSLCNTCIEVKLGNRTVKGKIGDECPECVKNQIDLHCSLYWDLYDNSGVRPSHDSQGRLTGAQWRLVPCAATGRRHYALKTGSGGGSWFAIQVRNSPVVVSQFELQPSSGGGWTAGKIDDQGFFVWNGLKRGGTYNVRLNGAVVDVVTLPSQAVSNPTNQVTAKVIGQRDISTSASSCTDNPPDTQYTCAQQAGWGKCGESWMQGHCNYSCGRCK